MTHVSLSNLRAIVIIIVVAFHSSLAYLVWAPIPTAAFDQAPYSWQAFPVVDAHRWIVLDIFCAWQDVSLMALMFMLSGLLTVASLLRKKTVTYLSDRLWRIGLPFVLAVVFLSPLSFFPAYLVRASDPSVIGFWQQWNSLPAWPEGPQWFLWLLLVFNAMAAVFYAIYPPYVDRLRRLVTWLSERPFRLFGLLVALSTAAYVPLALTFSPWDWTALGPFSWQICRPVFYLVYFFTGVCLGSIGLERGSLAADGVLARNWAMLLIAALVSFGVWAGLTSLAFPDWNKAAPLVKLGVSLAFPLACASGGLFLLAFFQRFATAWRSRLLDSLSVNAYSIYLLHYVFVVWLQFAFLRLELFAGGKALVVLTIALAISWAASVAFDRLVAAVPLLAPKRTLAPRTRA
jgi:surface polysaccharide O-acyltransferase-like enzyme